MSYTRTFSESITISGYETVSYPASEYGGTLRVPYSQTETVDINITVATEPFDEGIANTKFSIDGLTASVAAMNTANCLAIAENADRVSKSITRGFFDLIKNDISTKQTETNTLIQTKSALLLEHSKAVQDKHDRMLSDVERERAKYGKLFSDMDKELERRITELDRPAFNLSRKVRENVVIKPYLTLAAPTSDQLGTIKRQGGIEAASLRQKVTTVLKNLANSLKQNLSYRHMMRNSLWEEMPEQEQSAEYIPVAYCVFDNLRDQGKLCQSYVSEIAGKDSILATVTNYVSQNAATSNRAISDNEMKFIDQAFSNLVQDNASNINGDNKEFQERVYAEICKMWKESSPQLTQI